MVKINRLTSEEIAELNVHAAQRILAKNTNILNDINNELFEATQKLGEARIQVEQLKHAKNTVIEINRALKSMVQNG
jgi:hypothetical protein